MPDGEGDLNRATGRGEGSLALFRERGDAAGIHDTLHLLGVVAEDQGEFARARTFFEEALQVARPLNVPMRTGWSMRHVGWMRRTWPGDTSAAEPRLEEALALFRRVGSHEHGVAHVLATLGGSP